MEIAKKIEKLIEEKGYNKHQFAKKAGIPYTTLVSLFNRGGLKAGVNTVIKICETLGVKVEDLFEEPLEKETPPTKDVRGEIQQLLDEIKEQLDKLPNDEARKSFLIFFKETIQNNPNIK